MADSQQPSDSSNEQEQLEAAAHTLYAADSAVKYYLLHRLIQDNNTPISLKDAAQAARVPASMLKPILKADRVFSLLQLTQDGGYLIRVDKDVLLQKHNKATDQPKTIIKRVAQQLLNKNEQPVALLHGKHPVRPDRPTCYAWVRHHCCDWDERCVFHHPDIDLSMNPKRMRRKKGLAVLKQAGQAALAEVTAFEQHGRLPKQVVEGRLAAAAAAAQAAMSDGSGGSSSSRHAGVSIARSSSGVSSGTAPPAAPPPSHNTPGQWQVYQSSAPHYPMNQPLLDSRRLRPAALPILPPPSTNRALPNPDDWVPDKKQKQKNTGATGAAAAAASSSSGCSSSSAAAAAAAVEAAWGAAAGPSAAGTDAWAAGAAAAGAAAGGVNIATAAEGPSASSSAAAAAAPPFLMAGEARPAPAADMRLPVAAAACTSTSQLASSSSSTKAVGAGVSSSTLRHHQWPLLGFNEEGLPMFKGAPCCPTYLGTGQCSAGGSSSSCRYHHPLAVLIPECVLEGFMPCPVFPGSSVPFSRLVIHLQRLWDYESCEEAQLKVWLAHHLLAAANPGCSMFNTSAARPAVENAVAAAAGGPSTRSELQLQHGRYSCSLEEADNVLQALWLAAPREEEEASSGGCSDPTSTTSSRSSSIMPYSGRIAELLQGDPYLQLVDVGGGGSSGGNTPAAAAAVKLQVEAIKELINL